VQISADTFASFTDKKRPMKRINQFLIFFFLAIPGMQAQLPAPEAGKGGGAGLIHGSVRDAQALQMMEYANVVLLNSKDSTMVDGCITAADGSFELKNVPWGTYILNVQFVGFAKKTIAPVVVSKDSPAIDLGIIELSASASSLGGVEIRSETQQVEYKIDKKVVNVSKDIASANGTAVDALRNVPSVQVDAEGNVSVRGSSNFTVLVNGRAVSQSANDVLKQTPVSTIENIEIITNPSAKYDPDGTAGIINIILKKNRRDGMNGMINASYGTLEKYGVDGQFNVKTGDFNIFGGAEYGNRLTPVKQKIDKVWYAGDTNEITKSVVDQKYRPWQYKFNLGADWYIDKQNTLSLSGVYFRQNFTVNSPVAYHIYTEPATTDQWLNYTNDLLLKHHWIEGDLNYTHNFKKQGHTLSINMVYNTWAGDKSDDQIKTTTTPDWAEEISVDSHRRRNYDNGSYRLSGDIDYSLPVSDHVKIEAGYSGDYTAFNSDYLVSNYDPDAAAWILDSSLSNGFDFKYQVHALYGTVSGDLWGLEYQLGLRGEYFDRQLITNVPDTNYKMEVWSLFPTFHLSKSFKNGHQLMFSYSRRVNRPEVMQLNPLPYFNDDFLVHRGNPSLRPEYANSLELSYQKTFKESFLSVGTYYRSTDDKMVQTIGIHEGQTILTNENIAKDWAVGLEVMANLNLKKYFRLNTSLDVFTYHLIGDAALGVPDRETFSATVSLNPTFILKSGTIMQLRGTYAAPGIDAIGKMDGFVMLDAAVKQNFLKGKLSLTLSGSNLFNLTKYSYTDNAQTYNHHFEYIPEGNVISLGLSYKINNYAHRASSRQGNGAVDVGF
jgi:outer membrane receptor protein involved in Fe transport